MEVLSMLYNYPSQFEYVSGETPLTHWTYPLVFGALYMTTILGLRWVMNQTERRIEARWFAAVHNFNMWAISLVTFLGMAYGTVKLGLVRMLVGPQGTIPKSGRVASRSDTTDPRLVFFGPSSCPCLR